MSSKSIHPGRIKRLVTLICLLSATGLSAQPTAASVDKAMKVFLNDPQVQYGTVGFQLIRLKDNLPVYGFNQDKLMAPASTQKVITAATALELLKENYRFATGVYTDGAIKDRVLQGNIRIYGSGDPSLGSSRYGKNKAEAFIEKIIHAIREKKIAVIHGNIVVHTGIFNDNAIPGGWNWEDIGNYYGAGASGFNWRENQFDVLLESGPNTGDKVSIVKTQPELYFNSFSNLLVAGAKGSGDNAYLYFSPGTDSIILRGTIPAGEKNFSVSGSLPQPAVQFLSELSQALMKSGIEVSGRNLVENTRFATGPTLQLITEQVSPAMDSLIYWFLQKSINLYGEAILKTLAANQAGTGNTDAGILLTKAFLQTLGIPGGMIQTMDGSGLSPQNAVTPEALAKLMAAARKRSWYPSFNKGLPLINQFKMKSGSIGGVRCYTGYLTDKKGGEYAFTLMVNHYNGNASALLQKMWKLLESCR